MRIPNEASPLYLSEIANKAGTEANQPKPVDGLANLRAASSKNLPALRQARTEGEPTAEENQDRRNNRGQHEHEERRKEERRKEQRPILLDTRLTRSRRESARDSAIDLKV